MDIVVFIFLLLFFLLHALYFPSQLIFKQFQYLRRKLFENIGFDATQDVGSQLVA